MNTYEIKFLGTAETERIQARSFVDNGLNGVLFFRDPGGNAIALFKNVSSVKLIGAESDVKVEQFDTLNTQGQTSCRPQTNDPTGITCS